MNIHFQNPGFDYSLSSILLFQTEETSPFWSDSLLYFYPQIQREELRKYSAHDKREYLTELLSKVYSELEDTLTSKVIAYNSHFSQYKSQIEAALSDAFQLDSRQFFNDLQANITMNPICPRFLQDRRFDLFYKNSERGALGISIHEVIHYFWFHVWNTHFGDSYEEYENPSLKWILSEMVVESIMADPRLSSINPYFPRENGGCVYPYFQNMMIEGLPVLQTLDKMYHSSRITDFMELSYRYCQKHEDAIRSHIEESEKSF